MKFGVRAIETNQKNELGEVEKVETSIIELIVHEMERDELSLSDITLNEIYTIFKDGVKENILYGSKTFIQHENQEIVKVVTDIESSPFELSRHWFDTHNIDISGELDKLQQAVFGALYAFKMAKLEERIDEIRIQLSPEHESYSEENIVDLLAEQMALEKVKTAFAGKLGRTVL